MLEQLFDLIKSNAEDLVVKNDAVPNQHNDDVIKDAADVTENELMKAVSSGNFQDLLGIFSQKGSNESGLMDNPIVKNIMSGLMGKLSSNYNINTSNAQSITSTLIPMVLSKFNKKVNDPQDKSIDINSLIGTLTGGKTKDTDFGSILDQVNKGKSFDLGSMLGQFMGGGNDNK